MSSADFTIKSGDTLPILQDTLTYSDGSSVNLTGAAVQFVMRSQSATTAQINAAATIVNPTSPATVQYAFLSTDTAGAYGQYLGSWLVTFAGGATMTFPTDGYLDIWVEQPLTDATLQSLVGLPDVKDYLKIPATDRTRDQMLMRWILASRSVVEEITGPIIPRTYDEWYDGGQWAISLRHRPLYNLQAVSMYLGPVEYVMAIVTEPQDGSIFSVMTDGQRRVIRRGPGGSQIPFPAGQQTVHIVYQAGYQTIPENVRLGTLELIAENYLATQTPGGPSRGSQVMSGDREISDHALVEFAVSERVRSWLVPHQRHPAIY